MFQVADGYRPRWGHLTISRWNCILLGMLFWAFGLFFPAGVATGAFFLRSFREEPVASLQAERAPPGVPWFSPILESLDRGLDYPLKMGEKAGMGRYTVFVLTLLLLLFLTLVMGGIAGYCHFHRWLFPPGVVLYLLTAFFPGTVLALIDIVTGRDWRGTGNPVTGLWGDGTSEWISAVNLLGVFALVVVGVGALAVGPLDVMVFAPWTLLAMDLLLGKTIDLFHREGYPRVETAINH